MSRRDRSIIVDTTRPYWLLEEWLPSQWMGTAYRSASFIEAYRYMAMAHCMWKFKKRVFRIRNVFTDETVPFNEVILYEFMDEAYEKAQPVE